jgi:hypothetical protein
MVAAGIAGNPVKPGFKPLDRAQARQPDHHFHEYRLTEIFVLCAIGCLCDDKFCDPVLVALDQLLHCLAIALASRGSRMRSAVAANGNAIWRTGTIILMPGAYLVFYLTQRFTKFDKVIEVVRCVSKSIVAELL